MIKELQMGLAIIISHPIQYYAPFFQLLAKRTPLKVFYTCGTTSLYDRKFLCQVNWDIPLLEGYDYTFLKNTAKHPGTHHFLGIINPDAFHQIEEFNPRHLLIYGWSNLSHFKIIRHFEGKVKIIFRGDSILPGKYPLWKRPFKKIFLTWLYSHADTILYAGTNNKAYFKYYGVKEEKLHFLPHSVDNERFNSTGSGTFIRKSLGLKETDSLLLFAGKFNKGKNPILLLKAFRKLNKKNHHLLYIGSGPLQTLLEKEAKTHPNIHILPFQNQKNMPSFYKACNLFCLPSLHETWGLSINEAMACGKAVLVSDQCGAATDLVTATNGMVFKNNDLNDLTTKLDQLLQCNEELERAGIASAELISKWNFYEQVKSTLKCL
ncbi:glycosyl transferase family 1 [Pedobacter sp. HMWF019]|uniref:glycosyltransferase family 4 protein n=1 Tax=Pedobacter sp. HMWF019 TaxID=2056856 RepID=UPI000D358395|nr:glycosyltransferase family 4 protein [Pedobacter sp. HMWF019]PTS91997.1 glycosyl transferase family 1 [Pedobacter sp. HMWF019]